MQQKTGLPDLDTIPKEDIKSVYYHYTSYQTFENILKSKKLWLNSYKFMNDSSELEWSLKQYLSLAYKTSRYLKADYITKNDLLSAFRSKEDWGVYFFCMSKYGDKHLQSHCYSDECRGVSIGIDLNKLKIDHDIFLQSQVFYTDLTVLPSANQIDLYIDKFLDSTSLTPTLDNKNIIAEEIIKFILPGISHVKGEYYDQENEFRIICILNDYNSDKVTLVKDGERINRIEIDLPEDAISEVILGQRCWHTEDCVKNAAKATGYKGIDIKQSERTLRSCVSNIFN